MTKPDSSVGHNYYSILKVVMIKNETEKSVIFSGLRRAQIQGL
jgi:hypothetical protein